MELAQYIYSQVASGLLDESEGRRLLRKVLPSDIAIVGMSCEYTGAPDLFAFEEMLRAGRNGFTPFPSSRRKFFPRDHEYLVNAARVKGSDPEELFQKMCDQLGAYIDGVDLFDNDHFEISDEEATYIDPMHRIILKHLYLALEHSGTTRSEVQGTRAAVYVGKDRSIAASYASEIEKDSELINPGTWEGILASRLNYLYDLSGGSLVIDTACSSSLVATHIARKMLRDKEIDVAMVGGIALGFAPRQGEMAGDYASVETPRDHLKVFDQASSGTIFGEGAGVVVLRRLEDALERNDHIYAILRATGINSDGRSNGLTAPNPKAQAALIAETYAAASISPSTIGYVDAHGTGTKLGDPIEIRGLTDAFRTGGDDSFGTCALSSLKENIGHTVGAAGVGGMIKMALALDSQMIFPSNSFVVPNDYIKFVDTPFYLPQVLSHWEAMSHPRRGAVSSFGFSGTNGHVILEESIGRAREPRDSRPLPFVFSAPSRDQLFEVVNEFLAHRELVEEQHIVDVAYTLARRRQLHDVRLAFSASTHAEFFGKLMSFSRAPHEGTIAAEYILLEKAEGDETRSESARMITEQYAQKPEMFSLDERLRLTMHGSGDFLSDFDYGDAVPCGLPGFRFAKKSFWGSVRTYDIYEHGAEALGHPMDGQLLDNRVLTTPDTDIYSMTLDTSRWFLQDHRIAGESTLSGTAYAQLAAEIALIHFGDRAYELSRMMFKNLIQVHPGERRVVYVQVAKRNATDLTVDVFSPENVETEQPYIPHSSFTLRRFDATTVSVDPVDQSSFDGVEWMTTNEEGASATFLFSGRWDLRRNHTQFVRLSDTEYVLAHQLDSEFVDDVEDFHVSPSMLDLLAGVISWERSVAVSRQFLPLSYGKLIFTGSSLTPRSFSRTQLHYHPGTDPSVASADVWVYNDRGELVVFIERYSMRVFVPRNELLEYHEIQLVPTSAVLPLVSWPEGLLTIVGAEQHRERAIATVPEEAKSRVASLPIDALEQEGGDTSQTLIYVSDSSVDEAADPSAQLEAFFNFAKSYPRHIAAGGNLIVLVGHGLSPKSGDPVSAADYALLSAARVLAMENPKISVFAVSDIEYDVPRALAVAAAGSLSGRRVLLNHGNAYVEKFVPVVRSLPARRGLPSGGTVIVTGGFGGIGAEYVSSLWHELGSVITVLGRRSLEELEASEDSDDRARAVRLRDLVAEGLELSFIRCNVAEEAEVVRAITETLSSGRAVEGVVHLAGVAEDGMLFRKTASDFHGVVDAKALGAAFLLKHLDPDSLQFFIVSSSMTTITGAPGQFAYTLANAFLEGLARSNTVVSATRWPGWIETGMALAFDIGSAPVESFPFEPLATAAATGYVRQSFTREYVDLIAGRATSSAESILGQFVEVSTSALEMHGGESALSSSRQGAEMVIKDFASLSVVGIDRELDSLEKLIAVLFASVLDIVEIDVEMSFTDMGGDSMKAFSIYTPLVEQLNVDLEVADIFIFSSVLELSAHVRMVQVA